MASAILSHTNWHIICVLGSGNALDKKNEPIDLRMSCAFNFANVPSDIAFFGCEMPSMQGSDMSEAKSMELDWKERLAEMARKNMKLKDPDAIAASTLRLKALMSLKLIRHEDPEINNISSTCKEIVEKYLAQGDTVDIIINNRHQKRTRDLLAYRIKQAGLPVEETLAKVNFPPCPDIQSKGKAYFKAVGREAGAKFKAWLEINFGIILF